MILKAPCPVKEIMCAKGPKGVCKSCDKDSCEGDKKGKESKCHEGQCDECKCEKTKDGCKCENECKCSKPKDVSPQSELKAEKAPAKKAVRPKKTAPKKGLKSKEARRADRAAKRAPEQSE